MNSSPVGMPSRAGGMREVVCTAANDCNSGSDTGLMECVKMVRDRIVNFLATSKPLRSSAGWGS